MDGPIGEVRIYNAALTPAQIEQDYLATKNTYLSGTPPIYVPDNSNNWTALQNIGGYWEYQKVGVGGVQKQYITWQYAEVFLDQIGNGNTAFPSFRTTPSNASLSANVTQIKALLEPEQPTTTTSQGWQMITDVPPEPEGMYNEGGTDFPGGPELKTKVTDPLRLPVETLTFPLAFGTTILTVLGVFAATRRTKAGANGSMLLAIISGMVVYIFWTITGGGVVPAWPIAIFILVIVLLFLWHKPYENPLS